MLCIIISMICLVWYVSCCFYLVCFKCVLFLIPLSGIYNIGIDPYKKNRGWSELGLAISDIYYQYPDAVFVADDRRVLAEALYYMKNKPKNWVRWNADGIIHDHYELVTKHDDLKNEIGIMVSSEPNNKHFLSSFKKDKVE